MFEPQRRVGCRRTRRENEANAVLSMSLNNCIGACRGLSHLARTMYSHSARARSHAARSGVHAEARRWSTSPPHHLTSRRRKKHSNPPTTRCRAFCTEAFSITLTKDLARDVVYMRLSRARSLAARSGVLMEARRWSLLAPASFVSLFFGRSQIISES